MVSSKFLKFYRILCYEILFLIAFGGSVRAMNAGLACPDWPLCFGDFIPDFHIQVYFEFIHRVLAGMVGLFIFGFGIYLIRKKDVSNSVKLLSVLSMVTVFLQVIMGGLTVLLLLKESVVTTHLFLATLLFASVLLIYWELRGEKNDEVKLGAPSAIRYFSFILIGLLWCQIILGGTVASHYAALACPDFPLCQGQFIPTLSGAVGLNVLHRLGAYACVIYIMGFYWAVSVYVPKEFKIVKKWTKRLAIGIWLQVALGISNVLFVTPPLIVVLHLTLGTILFGISLRIAYLISYGEAQAGNELYASNTALTGN